MSTLYLCFCAGIIFAGYLPQLPPPLYCIISIPIIFAIAFFLCRKYPQVLIPLTFIVGVNYGIFCGYRFIANELIDELVGQDIVIEGQVKDLPEEDSRHQLFSMNISRAYSDYRLLSIHENFPRTINLSSYGDLRVKTGEHWRLLVKLKKPRGFVNPDGFDYQVFLMRSGVGAVGYVRQSAVNQLLQPQPGWSMGVLRYELQQWLIKTSRSPEKSILIALLVGDTSLVDKGQWDEMIKTGTNHLIAISGLHLGFFAIVGFFAGNLAGRFIQLFIPRCPAMVYGYFCSVFCAVFYSIVAGLNIPTVRTLIMLGVVQGAYLFRRSFRGRDVLLLALVLVLLYDPLAAFDIGFWLSFGAVGMLIFCFSGRLGIREPVSTRKSLLPHLREFIKSQWIMFIGLLIPLSLLVHTSSLLAPLANVIAIPLVTFFVVPCLILAALCHFTVNIAESFFLHCAEQGLSVLHLWLQYLLTLGAGNLNPLININPWALALACLSVFMLLLPRGLGPKYPGYCGLLLALVIPFKKLPSLQMLVFDVGQGTAILLRTPHYQLLYDTGPVYTENFDAGSALIVPYLKSQGLRQLDAIVVSHNDMDHSGGLAGVLAATRIEKLFLGEPEKYHPAADDTPVINCHTVDPWQWDDVIFRFITWPVIAADKANNHSCVLLVEYQGHKVLLTGDIEKEVERTLIANDKLMPVDVLLAPHHGSKTSSTSAFVAQTQPVYVIYSAGYRNQHGHPQKDVQARYAAINAIPLNTAFSGALEFEWGNGQLLSIRKYREADRRYWFSVSDN